jgi:hypothetical protein
MTVPGIEFSYLSKRKMRPDRDTLGSSLWPAIGTTAAISDGGGSEQGWLVEAESRLAFGSERNDDWSIVPEVRRPRLQPRMGERYENAGIGVTM